MRLSPQAGWRSLAGYVLPGRPISWKAATFPKEKSTVIKMI